MRKFLFLILISVISISICGCTETLRTAKGPCTFAANRVHIVGITAMEENADKPEESKISVYLSLHDKFDASLKFPGVFRFELYRHVPRSAQPKGKRIASWPDFDLNDPVINNQYWNDFLRLYYFELNANVSAFNDSVYVIQATFVTPNGRRLTDLFEIKK